MVIFHVHKDFHKMVLFVEQVIMLNSNQTECQTVAVCWHVLFSVVGLVDGLEVLVFLVKFEMAHQRGK